MFLITRRTHGRTDAQPRADKRKDLVVNAALVAVSVLLLAVAVTRRFPYPWSHDKAFLTSARFPQGPKFALALWFVIFILVP